MHRLRFPLASAVLASAASLAGGISGMAPAWAQSAPALAVAEPPAAAPISQKPSPARIEDIQVARDGDKVSILIKLSAQPSSASATPSPSGLAIEIDGVSLAPLSLTPQAGQLVTGVEAKGAKLSLSGAALIGPSTIIYRNAILVESRLADPASIGGVSLIRAPSAPKQVQPAPPAATPTAPSPAPVPPAALPPPAAAPTPASVTAAPPAANAIAAIAGLNASRCASAPAELAKDAWDLAAIGDTALCLLDENKIDAARARLDQLAAITPQDWRVPLGRAALADREGDADGASALYAAASRAAPDDATRSRLAGRIKAPIAPVPAVSLSLGPTTEPASEAGGGKDDTLHTAATPAHPAPAPQEPDLQLPLPSAPAAHH